MKKGRLQNRLFIYAIILLFFGAVFTPNINASMNKKKIIPLINGNTLYVGGSGPGNYTNIQDAIDDASDGDTVYVYNGTYYENVVVDKSISLIGQDKNTTIIDGNHSGDVIHISANKVNISGYTLRNASIYHEYHAGVFVHSNYNTIKGNIIINSHSFGIFLERFSHSNNIINNNISSSEIDGITLYSSNRNTIMGNRISSNAVNGILIRGSRNNYVSRNTIAGNKWGIQITEGYAILTSLRSGFNKIEENNFIENTKNANFHSSILNRWMGNYWDDDNNPVVYPIHGKLEFMIYSFYPFQPPLLYIEVPWINFDWRPAQEPYNI